MQTTTTTTKRILLIQDDRFLRRACETSLRERGFTVATAADGAEGLRAAQADPPDLILLDVLMPSLSGLDVLRAVRADERTSSVGVLVLSNSSKDRDIQAVTRLGAIGYLVKANLSLQELGDRVTKILGGI
jgi:DNA-binding response OmpR family regulator